MGETIKREGRKEKVKNESAVHEEWRKVVLQRQKTKAKGLVDLESRICVHLSLVVEKKEK